MNQRIHKYKGWDGKKMLPAVDLSQSGKHWGWLGKVDAVLLQYTEIDDMDGVELFDGDVFDYDYLRGGLRHIFRCEIFYSSRKASWYFECPDNQDTGLLSYLPRDSIKFLGSSLELYGKKYEKR